MLRHLKVILLTILLVIILTIDAHASNDMDGFMPSTENFTDSSIVAVYELYDNANYSFDVEDVNGLFHPIKAAFLAVANFLVSSIFGLHVMLTRFVTFILVSCYKVNIFNLIPDAINYIVAAVKRGLYDGFYELIIAAAGLFGIYKTYKGVKTSGYRILLSSVIILGLSVWFFSNPSGFGRSLNTATEFISANVLYEVTKPAAEADNYRITGPDDAVVLLGNQYWDMAVMKPYEFIQYGTVGKHDPAEFLAENPGSDRRADLVEGYQDSLSSFTYFGQAARLVKAFLMFLIGLVYNICMLAISILIVYNQGGAMFWVCFAGLFFLFSLYPKHGLKLIMRWALETFGFLLKRIVITIGLSIYFAITIALYSLTGDYGYLTVILLNITILFFAIINHKKIFELLMGMITMDQAMVNAGMQKESFGSKVAKGAVVAYTGKKLFNTLKESRQMHKKKSFEKGYRKKAESLLTKRYGMEKEEAVRNANQELMKRYNTEKQQAEARADERRKNVKPAYSSFVKQAMANREMGLPLFTKEQLASVAAEHGEHAEEVLNQRFMQEKIAAEKEAERLKARIKPEYSSFVNKVHKRREQDGKISFTDEEIQSVIKYSDFVKGVDFRNQKGYSPFSDEQISSTLNYMYKLKEEGSDPDRLLYTEVEGKSERKIRDDQVMLDRKLKQDKKQLKNKAKENNRTIEENIEGVLSRHTKPMVMAKLLAKRTGRTVLEDGIGIPLPKQKSETEEHRQNPVLQKPSVQSASNTAAVDTPNAGQTSGADTQQIMRSSSSHENKSVEEKKIVNTVETRKVTESNRVDNRDEITRDTEVVNRQKVKEKIINTADSVNITASVKMDDTSTIGFSGEGIFKTDGVATAQSIKKSGGVHASDVVMVAQALSKKTKDQQLESLLRKFKKQQSKDPFEESGKPLNDFEEEKESLPEVVD